MEYYQPQLIVKCLIYFLVLWFFIASFSDKDKRVNLVIFAMYLFNVVTIKEIHFNINSPEYMAEYIKITRFLVATDVFFGLVMYAVNKHKLNNYVYKQWALLGFVVLCHSMILWDLTISQSWLTGRFYTYYDELIIIIGLLQVWVSRDGILNVISRVQDSGYRFRVRYIHSSKVHLPRKERKG